MSCKSLYKIKPLINNYLPINYLHLLIITTNKSSCRYKQKMSRINFVKHICCCSLQRFLKNLKSEVLLLSKKGSQSCFYRTWKSISLRHQSSTLQRKNVTGFYLRRQIGAIQNYNMLPNRNQPSSSRNKSFD